MPEITTPRLGCSADGRPYILSTELGRCLGIDNHRILYILRTYFKSISSQERLKYFEKTAYTSRNGRDRDAYRIYKKHLPVILSRYQLYNKPERKKAILDAFKSPEFCDSEDTPPKREIITPKLQTLNAKPIITSIELARCLSMRHRYIMDKIEDHSGAARQKDGFSPYFFRTDQNQYFKAYNIEYSALKPFLLNRFNPRLLPQIDAILAAFPQNAEAEPKAKSPRLALLSSISSIPLEKFILSTKLAEFLELSHARVMEMLRRYAKLIPEKDAQAGLIDTTYAADSLAKRNALLISPQLLPDYLRRYFRQIPVERKAEALKSFIGLDYAKALTELGKTKPEKVCPIQAPKLADEDAKNQPAILPQEPELSGPCILSTEVAKYLGVQHDRVLTMIYRYCKSLPPEEAEAGFVKTTYQTRGCAFRTALRIAPDALKLFLVRYFRAVPKERKEALLKAVALADSSESCALAMGAKREIIEPALLEKNGKPCLTSRELAKALQIDHSYIMARIAKYLAANPDKLPSFEEIKARTAVNNIYSAYRIYGDNLLDFLRTFNPVFQPQIDAIVGAFMRFKPAHKSKPAKPAIHNIDNAPAKAPKNANVLIRRHSSAPEAYNTEAQ